MVHLPMQPRSGALVAPEDDSLQADSQRSSLLRRMLGQRFRRRSGALSVGSWDHSAVAMWLFATAWMVAWLFLRPTVSSEEPRQWSFWAWGGHHGLGALRCRSSAWRFPRRAFVCASGGSLRRRDRRFAAKDVSVSEVIVRPGDAETSELVFLLAGAADQRAYRDRSGHLAPPRGAGAPAGARRARRRNVVLRPIHSIPRPDASRGRGGDGARLPTCAGRESAKRSCGG